MCFKSDDFSAFDQPDIYSRVEYIKNDLHPRLKKLGMEIKSFLEENTAVSLRCQLRSGRWFKPELCLWTHVSIVDSHEERRSDGKRPRLSVFIDEQRVIVGFFKTLWRSTDVLGNRSDLCDLVDAVHDSDGLEIGILHRVSTGEGETFKYNTMKDAYEGIEKLGQDFFFVGREYQWPQQKRTICSSLFAEELKKVILAAHPVYEYCFSEHYVKEYGY